MYFCLEKQAQAWCCQEVAVRPVIHEGSQDDKIYWAGAGTEYGLSFRPEKIPPGETSGGGLGKIVQHRGGQLGRAVVWISGKIWLWKGMLSRFASQLGKTSFAVLEEGPDRMLLREEWVSLADPGNIHGH